MLGCRQEAFLEPLDVRVSGLTVLRDLALGGLSNDPNVTNVRRLCLVLDGRSKRIRWYVDGLQVAEYTYATTPGRLAGANGTFLQYKVFVPAATTSRLRHTFGGTWQHIRVYEIID